MSMVVRPSRGCKYLPGLLSAAVGAKACTVPVQLRTEAEGSCSSKASIQCWGNVEWCFCEPVQNGTTEMVVVL